MPVAKRPVLLIGLVSAALAAFTLASSHRSSRLQNARPAPGSGSRPSGKTFLGRYGYMLHLPEGYAASSEFKDIRKATEVVHIFPEKTDASHFMNEGLYEHLGLLRLEVSPVRLPAGRSGLRDIQEGVLAAWAGHKVKYTLRETQVSGMPGFVVNITSPFPAVRAYILGNRLLYVLTGGAENAVFTGTLLSLHEVSAGADR